MLPTAYGRILALKRSGSVRTHPGKWAGVKGTVADTTPLQQALIEILEETGLSWAEVRVLRRGKPLDIPDQENQVKWRVYPFLVEVADPSLIRLDWKHSESQWDHPDQLSILDTVPRLEETW